MIPIAETFYDRIANALDSSNSLAQLTLWICKNTKLGGKPFSFKHHEYQMDIIDDSHSRKNIKKCAQVGLSELSVRLTLGFLAVSRDKRAIYTLPTARFSTKFSKDRFDPVIEQSEALSALRIKSADSAEMKRLGSCTLYLNGTYGQTSAISVPANMLIHDEIDFSSASVISTYQSRLRHAEEDKYGFKGITYRFSTPTVKGFGISAAYEHSTQKNYLVKCSACNDWSAPDFFRDVVLLGYDDDLSKFTQADAKNPKYKLEEAYIACPKCGHDLSQDLLDPNRREWVEANPSAREAGWQVNPFDVPVYNKIPGLLLQAGDYKRTGDWHNFVLGIEYEDADNTFLEAPFSKGRTSDWTIPEVGAVGTYAGLDVGKVSHFIIGKDVNGRIEVIYACTIKMTSDLQLAEQVKKLMDAFGVGLLVIDAMPDFSTALALIGMSRPDQVYANYYTQTTPKNKLTNLLIKEAESVVSSYKAGTFDDLCKLHNGYSIAYPTHPEMDEVKRHLKNLKKVVNTQSEDAEEATGIWIRTGDDHYGHAMNYMNIARDLMDEIVGSIGFSMPPSVSKIKMKTEQTTKT